MKKTISAVALLLAVLMLAMFCAGCGDKKNDDSAQPTDPATTNPAQPDESDTGIVGTWSFDLDYESLMQNVMDQALESMDDSSKALAEEMFKCYSGVTMQINMQFNADGTYKTYADEASIEAAFKKIKRNLKDRMPSIFEALGVAVDDLESALAEAGYSLDDYVDTVFDQQLNTADVADEMNAEGRYRVDGDRLYTAVDGGEFSDLAYLVFSVTGNKLRITEVVGAGESISVLNSALLPLELTRA